MTNICSQCKQLIKSVKVEQTIPFKRDGGETMKYQQYYGGTTDSKIKWFERVIRRPHTVLYIKSEESVPLLLLEILKELKSLRISGKGKKGQYD